MVVTMATWRSLPFCRDWDQGISAGRYVRWGFGLLAIKLVIDLAVANIFVHAWSPLQYVIWPGDRPLGTLFQPGPEQSFAIAMTAVSLPFIWAGIMLTLQRLRAAGLPLTLVLLFFVPVVNLLMFALLSIPTRARTASEEEAIEAWSAYDPPSTPLVKALPGDTSSRHARMWLSAAAAVGVGIVTIVPLVALATEVMQMYGAGLFLGTPFALGLIAVLIFGRQTPQSFGACIAVAFLALSMAGGILMALALEGAICLLMAAPLGYALAFLGGLVGYIIQSRPWLQHRTNAYCLALLATLPGLMAAETASEPAPVLRQVVTTVKIAAEPERVWSNVIQFPPLAEPDDWLFRAGVAYPQRAEIFGHGAGAMRHCVFSTGTFVEPIDIYEPPSLLSFRVTEQPEPMREWSPYTIHPPHLHNYLVSQRGQFELTRRADGHTQLTGTTWYTNRMWPAAYWGLWSDVIIARIHRRVLEHIRIETERGS